MRKLFLNTLNNETIAIFPATSSKCCQFIGTGYVVKVSKGDEYDIVNIRFGLLTNKSRPIVVYDNHARRQIMLLKKGNRVWVSGTGIIRKIPVSDPRKPTLTFFLNWYFMGYDFNQSYVPTARDIKTLASEGETEQVEELQTNNGEFYQGIIDDLLNLKRGELNDED